MPDFILNGQATGSVASRLMENNFNPAVLRPFIGGDGRSYCTTTNSAGKQEAILTNATATLRKDEWIFLDQAIVRAATPRLRAVADLRAAGLEFQLPNGLSRTVFETQNVSGVTGAKIGMDPVNKSENDRPVYDLGMLPLPVIYKDFSFSARQLAAARNSGAGIDVTSAELAARSVAEEAEKLLLGVSPSFSYGGGSVYGYTNSPARKAVAMTLPSTGGWTPLQLLKEVLAMRTASTNQFHFGPWVLYFSTDWSEVLDNDFSTAKGDLTLRQRIAMIDGITAVRTLDYLPAHTAILLQTTSDVARMIIGMEIQTLQWETNGGLEINFKVMTIQVPQIRADFNGNSGVIHGTAV